MYTPAVKNEDRPAYQRRHAEWYEHNNLWQWLYDSWEGGERYRSATYGTDSRGQLIYNLVRHKHEYPDVGSGGQSGVMMPDMVGADAAARAWEDDFQYRRARTPVPAFVEYAADSHLSKLYAHEVEREGPDALVKWWKNVDGMGSTIDDWMQDTIAPLLLVLGQLDVLFDHPAKPDGAVIRSKADQDKYGLTDCVATFILPQNMVWWKTDRQGFYAECVVREAKEDGCSNFRYWTDKASFLFDEDGRAIGTAISHEFGKVPIVRLYDRRNPRCKNVGRSRYQTIAMLQREYYNRDSELILSDTHQAFPLLQGPEDYIKNDAEIPIGPQWLLPMVKNDKGGTATYQGFEVINFPKDGADSIRANKADILDAVDRNALLTKPAGTAGTTGHSVAQSGVSKRLDQAAGNDLLTKVSARIQTAELVIARWALMVLGHPVQPGDESIKITYPRSFDLATADELATAIVDVQKIIAASGGAPLTETEMIRRLIRQAVPGLVDQEYREMDAEIEARIKAKSDALAVQDKLDAQTAEVAASQAAASANAPPVPQANPFA